jgi:hypothetical protein
MKMKYVAARSSDLEGLTKIFSNLMTLTLTYYGRPPSTKVWLMQNLVDRGQGSPECLRLIIPRSLRDRYDKNPDA